VWKRRLKTSSKLTTVPQFTMAKRKKIADGDMEEFEEPESSEEESSSDDVIKKPHLRKTSNKDRMQTCSTLSSSGSIHNPNTISTA